MKRAPLLIGMLVLPFLLSAVTTYNWTGVNGAVNDPANYNPVGVPGAGDYAKYDVAGSYTVTIPSGTVYAPTNQIYINAKPAGNTVTFDGRNAEIFAPDSDDPVYQSEPFKIYAYGGLMIDLEEWWGATGNRKKSTPFRFTDFLFKVSAADDLTGDSVEFVEGTYHFDYGNLGTRKNLLFAYGNGTDKPLYITARENSSITFAPLLWSVKGRNSRLRFTGGQHVQSGSFENDMTYVNYDTETSPGHASFEVVGKDTSFTFNSSVYIGRPAFPNRTFNFLAADGGSIVFNKYLETSRPGTHVFTATNGGSLAFHSVNLGEFSTGTTKLIVNDSKLDIAGGTSYFGGTSEETGGFIAGITNSAVNINGALNFQFYKENMRVSSESYIKNTSVTSETAGTVKVWGGMLSMEDSLLDLAGGLFIYGGNTYLKNCNGGISHLVSGSNNSVENGNLEIDGGALVSDGVFVVGHSTSGTLSVTGGKHVFNARKLTDSEANALSLKTQPASIGENIGAKGVLTVSGEDTDVTLNAPDLYIGNGGTGTFEMVSGKLKINITKINSTGQNDRNIYMASNARSSGTVRISGGEITTSAKLVGTRGTVDYLQTGGTVTVQRLTLGSFSRTANDGGSENNSMVWKITGGSFSCDESISVTDQTGYNGKLILDGGVVSATLVCGGNGSKWNGGSGSSVLQANGGTLKSVKSLSNFITQFDTAEVGPKGLVIDTDHEITVIQDFTAIPGGTGKIVKTGSGTLTLDCAISEDIVLEVREGDVVIKRENAFKGSIVTVGKGVVGFTANQTLASLTVGDEISAGGISIDDVVSVSVTGTVDMVCNGSAADYVFTKDETTGVTTIVKDTAEPQTLLIELDSGTSNATENLSFNVKDTLELNVAAGAELTASGEYGKGELLKTGEGKAFVGNQNNFFAGGVTVEEGILSFTSPLAFGMDRAVQPVITHKKDTLEYSGEDGYTSWDLLADAPVSTDAVVIKTDGDLTVTGRFDVASGALIKRGAGKLTLVAMYDSVLACDVGKTPRSLIPSGSLIFPADGSSPVEGYGGFNVVEGELELRGPGSFTIGQSGMLGANTTQAAETPVLTIRDTKVHMDKQAYLFCIGSACYASSSVQTQRLNVINSTVTGDTTLNVGWYSTSGKQHVDVFIDNSSIYASYQLWFNQNPSTLDGAYYTISNSSLYARSLAQVQGRSQIEFFGSRLAYDENDTPAILQIGDFSSGPAYMRFSENSVLALDQINPVTPNSVFELRFDGAVWKTGGDDTALKVKYHFSDTRDPDKIKIILEEGGAVFPVAEGNSLTVMHKIQGEGGLTKTGAGTMVFDTWTKWGSNERTNSMKWAAHPVTWTFDGEADITEGKLVVKEGAVRNGAKIRLAEDTVLESEGAALTNAVLRGSGTVTGGTLVSCTVKAPLQDDGTVADENILTMSSITASRLYFDLGFSADNGFLSGGSDPLTLAKWEGDAKPDVSGWRIVGLGGNFTSQFTANDDGTVTAVVKPEGFHILFK